MKEKSLQGIGVAFYTRAEWDKARAVMPDGHTFGSYDEFVARITEVTHQARAKGQAVIRVYINTDEYIAWCRLNGRQVNANSRAEYAGIRAAEQDNGR
jgi:hypothetical protein